MAGENKTLWGKREEKHGNSFQEVDLLTLAKKFNGYCAKNMLKMVKTVEAEGIDRHNRESYFLSFCKSQKNLDKIKEL